MYYSQEHIQRASTGSRRHEKEGEKETGLDQDGEPTSIVGAKGVQRTLRRGHGDQQQGKHSQDLERRMLLMVFKKQMRLKSRSNTNEILRMLQ